MSSFQYHYIVDKWLAFTHSNSERAQKGDIDSWTDFDGGWSQDPSRMEIKASYEYDKIYKTKNEGLGIAGLCGAGLGLYFLIAYAKESKAYNQFAKRHNIDICVAGNYKEISMSIVKTF